MNQSVTSIIFVATTCVLGFLACTGICRDPTDLHLLLLAYLRELDCPRQLLDDLEDLFKHRGEWQSLTNTEILPARAFGTNKSLSLLELVCFLASVDVKIALTLSTCRSPDYRCSLPSILLDCCNPTTSC